MSQFIFPPLTASLDSEGTNGGSLPVKQMIIGGYDGANVRAIKVDAAGDLQVDVVSSMPLPTGAATEAKQDVMITDLTNIETYTNTIQGAVSGTEMQVDIVASLPTGSNQIGKLAANSGVDIGDVDVLSSALPTGAATSALQTSSEALLTTIDADTSTLAGAVSGTEMQVDVVASLPAGSNNIGDVDVLSSALPTGAATSALQTSSEAILTTIDADTSSLAGCVSGTELQVDVVSGSVVVDTYSVVDFIDSTVAGYVADNGVIELSGTDTIPAKAASQLQLVASSAAAIKKIQTVEDIGEYMGIFTGASTAETLACVLPLGGGEVSVEIPQSTRISIRALTSGTAITSGSLGINFLG